MKRCIFIFINAFILMIFGSCSIKNKLIGKWNKTETINNVEYNIEYEFIKGGNAIVTIPENSLFNGTYNGEWWLVGENELHVFYNFLHEKGTLFQTNRNFIWIQNDMTNVLFHNR